MPDKTVTREDNAKKDKPDPTQSRRTPGSAEGERDRDEQSRLIANAVAAQIRLSPLLQDVALVAVTGVASKVIGDVRPMRGSL